MMLWFRAMLRCKSIVLGHLYMYISSIRGHKIPTLLSEPYNLGYTDD